MSVAVIAIQPFYMDPFSQKNPLTASSSLDSDSDAGYGTPAENFFAVEAEKKKIVPVSVEDSSDSDGGEGTDPELQEKIIKQVEWYFSDENLLKDSFLMKHINRNKQGYVSLKLVASLRKVKTLSKDWKVVLESVRHSKFLSLNEDETKIRRLSPPPQVDFSHIAHTLLITDYADQDPSLVDLEQQFGRYGEISRVRLLHPGRAIPLDVKPCKTQHASLGKELCILVEFTSAEVARQAQKKIREQQSWRDEMKVCLLGDKKSDADQDARSDGKKKGKGKDSKCPESPTGKQKKDNSPAPLRQKDFTPSPRSSREGTPMFAKRKVSPPNSTSSSSPSSPAPNMFGRRGRKSHGAKCSPEISHKHHLRPDTWKDYSSDSGLSSRSASESPKLTPEPTRRFFSGNSADLSWRSERHSQPSSCVIRQPLGPDGSRGFGKRRVNPISITVHSC